MADSGITKRALAEALKKQMNDEPFEKISIGDICDRCDMNRKSFYYHFNDKFELVNWIFDTEFQAGSVNKCGWDYLSDLCRYLYENRIFYRKAMRIQGQNAFSNHFHETLRPVMEKFVSPGKQISMDQFEAVDFCTLFLTDGLVCAIQRWLLSGDCADADAFLALVRTCMKKTPFAARD